MKFLINEQEFSQQDFERNFYNLKFSEESDNLATFLSLIILNSLYQEDQRAEIQNAVASQYTMNCFNKNSKIELAGYVFEVVTEAATEPQTETSAAEIME